MACPKKRRRRLDAYASPPSFLNPFSALRNAEEALAKGQLPELELWSIEPDRNNSSIPAKTGRIFAHFTGSRLFHRQIASLVGREGEISGESRGAPETFLITGSRMRMRKTEHEKSDAKNQNPEE
jgi:hypothetical protein